MLVLGITARSCDPVVKSAGAVAAWTLVLIKVSTKHIRQASKTWPTEPRRKSAGAGVEAVQMGI